MRRITLIMTCSMLAALSLTSCISKPKGPIETLTYSNPHANGEKKKLLIFLRGAGGGHEIFEEKGLVKQVINRKLPFDMVAPDAHFGYYKHEILGKRLHQDIILPAKVDGYDEIWIAGTSMGGLGALMFLTDYADDVQGVILLSPFLGWGGIIEEIKEAGGIAVWQPGRHTIKDWQRYLWNWLKQYDASATKTPAIYLGYGDDDFFTEGQQLLAGILPKGHTVIVDGGHTYSTLKKLWSAYLDKLDPQLRH